MWLERHEQALRETGQVLMLDGRKRARFSFPRGPPGGRGVALTHSWLTRAAVALCGG